MLSPPAATATATAAPTAAQRERHIENRTAISDPSPGPLSAGAEQTYRCRRAVLSRQSEGRTGRNDSEYGRNDDRRRRSPGPEPAFGGTPSGRPRDQAR